VKGLGRGLDEELETSIRKTMFVPGSNDHGPATLPIMVEFDFLVPWKHSRWHLLRVDFANEPGLVRPHFKAVAYPTGKGITLSYDDEALVIAALNRPVPVTLKFEIDKKGHPFHCAVQNDAEQAWAKEAVSFVSKWLFEPGRIKGEPVVVSCSLDLVWGERSYTHDSLVRAENAIESDRTFAKR
jgi:hypothetical protein